MTFSGKIYENCSFFACPLEIVLERYFYSSMHVILYSNYIDFTLRYMLKFLHDSLELIFPYDKPTFAKPTTP